MPAQGPVWPQTAHILFATDNASAAGRLHAPQRATMASQIASSERSLERASPGPRIPRVTACCARGPELRPLAHAKGVARLLRFSARTLPSRCIICPSESLSQHIAGGTGACQPATVDPWGQSTREDRDAAGLFARQLAVRCCQLRGRPQRQTTAYVVHSIACTLGHEVSTCGARGAFLAAASRVRR